MKDWEAWAHALENVHGSARAIVMKAQAFHSADGKKSTEDVYRWALQFRENGRWVGQTAVSKKIFKHETKGYGESMDDAKTQAVQCLDAYTDAEHVDAMRFRAAIQAKQEANRLIREAAERRAESETNILKKLW